MNDERRGEDGAADEARVLAGADLELDVEDLDPELAGLLGASLEPIEPSAGFEEALFARLDGVAQEVPAGRGASAEPAPDQAGAAPSSIDAPEAAGEEGLAEVIPLTRRAHPRLLRAVVAAAILVVGVGIGRTTAMTDMSDAHSYAMLNQSQDVERSTDTMPDGHVATLTWSSGMGKAAVTLPAEMSEGMTSSTSTKVLQVWVRHGSEVRSAGVYAPSKGMDFAFIDLMPTDGDEIFVTVEPAGGSEHPTTAPLVAMRVGGPAPSSIDEGGPAQSGGAEESGARPA